MTPPLVLVPSLAFGPATWVPVARVVLALGVDAVVPDLRHTAGAAAPYWPYVADVVSDAMGQLDQPGPVVLVAHGGTGRMLPALLATSPRPVAGAVLVDAGLPEPGGTPAAHPALLDLLRDRADPSGRLPPRDRWFDDAAWERLLPDPRSRAEVAAGLPRLPLDLFEQRFPDDPAWWTLPRAYLQLSDSYGDEAERSRGEGWPVSRLRAGHLHAVLDPTAVADTLLALVDELVG